MREALLVPTASELLHSTPMRKPVVLLFVVLLANSCFASPCVSWFYANPAGKGALRVRVVRGKLDARKLQSLIRGLNPADWDGLAGRLQQKLGSAYKVSVLTPAEFKANAHVCP